MATYSSILDWKIPWTRSLVGYKVHGVTKQTRLSTHMVGNDYSPIILFSNKISTKSEFFLFDTVVLVVKLTSLRSYIVKAMEMMDMIMMAKAYSL